MEADRPSEGILCAEKIQLLKNLDVQGERERGRGRRGKKREIERGGEGGSKERSKEGSRKS